MSAEESTPSMSEKGQAGVPDGIAGAAQPDHDGRVRSDDSPESPCEKKDGATSTEGVEDDATSSYATVDSLIEDAGDSQAGDGQAVPAAAAGDSQTEAGQTASGAAAGDSGNGGGVAGEGSQAGAESADSQIPVVPSGAGVAEKPGQKGEDGENEAEDESSMSFTEHLGELRMRIVRMLIGATVGFLLCYGVAEDLFRYLSLPLVKVMPPDTRFIYTSVPEGFFVYLKIAFVAGVFVASPYIFYQLWAFIAPGLYQEERRHIVPLALCSALFFLLGAAFCYWGVFPFAFTFFMSYSTGMIVAMPSLNEYLGFALKMLLAFGLIFEMPLFAFFLSRLRIITPAWMRKVRRYAILAIFIVAAILTPPDVFSQLLMAGPMLVLYEVSIYVAALARPRSGDTTKQAPSEKAGSADA